MATVSRKHLRFDGRRVRVRDLLDAGLLQSDQSLVFTRPRAGERHEATVSETGELRLGDRVFSSLSSAASAAAGTAVDGWHAWRLGDNGPFLHRLRQQLLDSNRSSAELTSEPEAKMRHQWLATISERGEELTVIEFLKQWKVDSRTQAVSEQIDADLENYDLITRPNYLTVGMHDVILVRKLSGGRDEVEDIPTTPRELNLHEIGVTLGNVVSIGSDVVTVNQNSTVEEAITLMLLHDYSQLPVVAGPRSIKGAVTWQSIAKARHRDPAATLSDAMVTAPEAAFDQELVDVLADLRSRDFVLVRGLNGDLAGIVTNADVVRAYEDLATPFLLIGELDRILRRIVEHQVSTESSEAVFEKAGRESVPLQSMTMGDYEMILTDPEVWTGLDWPISRKLFRKRLEELRTIRNDVMHFNRDGVPPQTSARFRHFIDLLRYVADR
ncbi:CBS domain-containing protein [Rhodococcoides corynebacterioides]|uniref:restriction system modified-DNA reader domain-containing protein n=1 Tax=Rhodococcoides corynebacterioides TaxID=53972 RepID=UPI001C9BBB28|nr:CBS domain-containing protein [Rhodococcus corynebacterioides]MBY6350801.1 CBS domain-containing protein [Rhodococcus corynebacterioides]